MDYRNYDQKRGAKNIDRYRPLRLAGVGILGLVLVLILLNLNTTNDFIFRLLEKILK
jgi:predicted PilT family ATPase